MFYQNYDDYMRDVFYFNGLSNPNNNNNMFFNMQNNQNQSSLNNYYPSIYKIIYPVIQRVISGGNYQFTNEDMINEIVNTVYGIVEGDINNLENTSSSNQDSRRMATNSSGNMNSQATMNSNNNNSLLRDLIKILVIKELITKSNVRRFPYNNPMMNMPYYACPYMVN